MEPSLARIATIHDPLLDLQIDAALMSRDFRAFVDGAWDTVEPHTKLEAGPHVDAICLHLEAVAQTSAGVDVETPIRNLVITMPPRMLKSTLVSVLWPAWCWTWFPGMRFLTASYSADLAIRDAVRTRQLIQSDWYQARWGDQFSMSADSNLKSRYSNDHQGFRIATSVDGRATGDGGDVVIVDDPHNVREADSEANLEATRTWWNQTMSTRMNDPRRSAKVIVQQRVHERDLAGMVIEQGGYEHLNLPMEYEPPEGNDPKARTAMGWEDWRNEEGEFLVPERFGPKEKHEQLLRLGEYGYAGQYQQRPAPLEGGILKTSNWTYWSRQNRPECFLLPERFDWIAAFWDTSFKIGQQNDYSAGALWAGTENAFWLLDLWWEKATFPQLLAAIQSTYDTWSWLGYPPDEIVIEDKASGQSIIQSLMEQTTLPIFGYDPGRDDKVARVHAISGYHAAGRYRIPHPDEATFPILGKDGFLKEHSNFPNASHDDRVDTTTMMTFYKVINPPERTRVVRGYLGTAVASGGWSGRRR